MYPRHVDEALKYSMATRNFRENIILGEYFESDFLRNAARQVVFIELTLFVFDAIMYIYEIHCNIYLYCTDKALKLLHCIFIRYFLEFIKYLGKPHQ